MEVHQEFFGMSLITYRVNHETPSENHVNVILVDDNGHYRGHIDAFSEPVGKKLAMRGISLQFHLLSEVERPRDHHDVFRVLFLMDLEEAWVLDLVVPPAIDILSLAQVVHRHVSDAHVVYKTVPEQMQVSVADLNLHLWIKGNLVMGTVLSASNRLDIEFIDSLLRNVLLLQQKLAVLSGEKPFRRSFDALLSILHYCPNLKISDVPILTRILVDHLFHVRVELRFKEHWPQVKRRLHEEFPTLHEFFEVLIAEKASVIDLLKIDRFSCLFREIIEAIDFINRRKLLNVRQ